VAGRKEVIDVLTAARLSHKSGQTLKLIASLDARFAALLSDNAWFI
jgi:hypothetical protein